MSTASKIITTAQAEVGYHEGRSGNNWNNHQKFSPAVPGLEWSQNQAWCATFVSWVAMKAGATELYPRTASTDVAARWWKDKGRWSEYPAVGAQGFLGHNGDMFHTFLVVRFDDTFIWTVEGNTNDNGSAQGDGVYNLKRRRRDAVIEGYGYPLFPEGIEAADPRFVKPASRPPVPTPKPKTLNAWQRRRLARLRRIQRDPHRRLNKIQRAALDRLEKLA